MSTETSGDKILRPLFETSIPIRWGDLDAFGHVNNTVYFRYMEEARVLSLQSIGVMIDDADQGPVLVHTAMEFLKPLLYPGQVLCKLSAPSPGRSSFEIHAELYRSDEPQTLYARGSAKAVWMNWTTGKSTPIPDRLRAALEGGGAATTAAG